MTAFANAPRVGILAALVAAAAAGLALPAQAQAQRQFSLTLYDQPDYRGGSVTFYGDNANIGSTGFTARARSAQVRGEWRLCEGGGYRNRCEVLSANVRDLSAYGLAGRVGSAQLLSGSAAIDPPRSEPRYPGADRDTYGQAPSPYPAPAYPDQRYAPPAPYAGPYGPAPYPADRSERDASDYAPPAVDAPPRGGPDRFADRDAPYAGAQAPRGEGGYPPAPYASNDFGDDRAEGRTAVFFANPRLRGQEISAWSGRAADGFCRAQGLGTAIYFDQSQRARRAADLDGRPVGEGPVLRDVLCRRN
jgi:hypothetical protein